MMSERQAVLAQYDKVEHELRLLGTQHRYYDPSETADDVILRGADALACVIPQLAEWEEFRNQHAMQRAEVSSLRAVIDELNLDASGCGMDVLEDDTLGCPHHRLPIDGMGQLRECPVAALVGIVERLESTVGAY